MLAFYSRHRLYFKAGVLAVVVVLYFVYFGYALYYEFGDEGSVRLLWVTCLVVAVLAFSLLKPILRQRLRLTSSSKLINYIGQHHWQINWSVGYSISFIPEQESCMNSISVAGLTVFGSARESLLSRHTKGDVGQIITQVSK